MQTNIPRKINTGMWVMADGRVGILTNADADATVDLVDEDGETVVAVQVPFESLRQAMLDDIPASRRPAPGVGAPLGYL